MIAWIRSLRRISPGAYDAGFSFAPGLSRRDIFIVDADSGAHRIIIPLAVILRQPPGNFKNAPPRPGLALQTTVGRGRNLQPTVGNRNLVERERPEDKGQGVCGPEARRPRRRHQRPSFVKIAKYIEKHGFLESNRAACRERQEFSHSRNLRWLGRGGQRRDRGNSTARDLLSFRHRSERDPPWAKPSGIGLPARVIRTALRPLLNTSLWFKSPPFQCPNKKARDKISVGSAHSPATGPRLDLRRDRPLEPMRCAALGVNRWNRPRDRSIRLLPSACVPKEISPEFNCYNFSPKNQR